MNSDVSKCCLSTKIWLLELDFRWKITKSMLTNVVFTEKNCQRYQVCTKNPPKKLHLVPKVEFYGVAHKRVTHAVYVVILCCSFMPGFYNHLGIAEEHKGVTTGYKATSSGRGW